MFIKLEIFIKRAGKIFATFTQYFKGLVNKLMNAPSQYICMREFKRQSFTRFNERPVEYGFVFKHLARIYPKKILDIGTGITALPHLIRNCGFYVTAIDNIKNYWPFGMFNRHYYIINDDITNTHLDDEFDLITCVSVLEHIENYDDAIKNMFSLLKPYGHIILTFPYTENKYIRNVYDLPNSSYGQNASFITQSFSRLELNRWLHDNSGIIIEQEYWRFWEGDYWTAVRQIVPPQKVKVNESHQLTCVIIQKRL